MWPLWSINTHAMPVRQGAIERTSPRIRLVLKVFVKARVFSGMKGCCRWGGSAVGRNTEPVQGAGVWRGDEVLKYTYPFDTWRWGADMSNGGNNGRRLFPLDGLDVACRLEIGTDVTAEGQGANQHQNRY